MKYREIVIDNNLYYLEYALNDLDKYKFDDDIVDLLNRLKTLVNDKMWGNVELNDYDILDDKIKIQLFLEKK